MNLSRIKQLVKQNGDKLVLMEHDEPDVVILSFAEYERLVKRAEGFLPLPSSAPAIHEPNPFPSHYNEEYSDIPDDANESPLREDGHEPYVSRIANSPSLPAMPRSGTGAERPRTPIHLEDVQLHDLPI